MAGAVLTMLVVFPGMALLPAAAQTWPTSWTWIDFDPNENGPGDDFRDVENAYYNFDEEYLYLRMECYDNAALTSDNREGRFKWFIDLDHNMHKSGQNIVDGEYLLFVEDTDPDDGTGEVYLLNDTNGDGKFDEWEVPVGYSGGLVNNSSVADYRITGTYVDLYVRLANISNPTNLSLIWITDSENPNLDQAPETDHPDFMPLGPFCVRCAPDCSLAKYDWPDPVKAGENLTYIIVYENTGNMNATNVTITEVYDANVTFVNATPAPDAGNTTWRIGEVPPGVRHYFNITVRVNDTVTNGTVLTNYVNVTCDEGPGHNHTVDTVVAGEPELILAKSAWPDPIAAGGNLTYTILFENIGNVTATNTTVNDTLPPEVTFISASPQPDVTDNRTIVWYIGNLPANDLRTITISVTVNVPILCGCNLVNYVNITADEVETVNHTERTLVCSAPVLEITKYDSLDPVEAGGQLNYTIYVTNTGCENATNVTVTELYDANVTFVNATPYPDYGNYIWNFSTLNVSETKTITITVNVTSPLPNGTILVNLVNATCDEGVKDQIYQDTRVKSAPGCSLAKYDWPDPVKAGENLTYTIIYENTGNMNATNVTLTEVYDANVTFVNATPAPDPGTNNTTWRIGEVTPAVRHYINITVRADDTVANGTILTNYVNVTCDGVPEHNHTVDTVVAGEPELILAKSAWPDPVAAGENLTYTIYFENIGAGNTANTTLYDTLPPEVSFISASGDYVYYPDNRTLFWDIGDLPPNDLRTITINVTVNCPLPCGCPLVNYVNLSADDVETVNHTERTLVCSVPVLKIEKFDSPDPVQVGGQLNYTIYVNNTGNANATNVTVTDEVSMANVTFVTSNPLPDTSGNNTWTWTNLSIAPGESWQITLTVQVDTLPPYGILFDFVNVTCDQNVENDKWQLTNVASPNIVDPKIAVDQNGPPLVPADIICYTLWINNIGDADSNDNPGNEFEDLIPKNTTYNPGSLQINDVNESDDITDGIGYDAANNTIIWNGNMTAGGSVKIQFCVTVDSNVTAGMVISNQGTVNYDSNGDGTNDATEPTDDPGTEEENDPTNLVLGFIPSMRVPIMTPIGMIALVGLLSAVAAMSIRIRTRR
ncbi:MAG: hypothetical protein WBC40_00255 [Halobacteriota archaeon]